MGLIGAGLLLYAGGSLAYNLDLATGSAVSFPSLADALWLSLFPLSFAGMVALVRARQLQVNASLWLDALIGGSVVAAVAAVFVLHPIVEMTAGQGWASAAHLAYPLCDLLLMGFAVVLWGAGRWRLDAWFGLAAGFALIAMSDGVYVAAQAGEGWTPGSTADLGYAAGSILLAASAWHSQPPPVGASATARVALPVTFTVASFGLVSYEAFTELDVLAVALDPPDAARRRAAARPDAVVAVAPARRPRGARGHRPADRARQLPRVPGAPRRRGGGAAGGGAAVASSRSTSTTSRRSTTPSATPRATACCRRPPTRSSRTVGEAGFVARIGGEEFALCCPDARRCGGRRDRRALPRRAGGARGARAGAVVLGRRGVVSRDDDERAAAAARRRRRAVLGQALGPQPRAPLRRRARRGAVEHRAAARGRGGARDPGRDRAACSSR